MFSKLPSLKKASGLLGSLFYFVSSKNSSFVKPASEIISISNPRFISSCFGTGTANESLQELCDFLFVEPHENRLLQGL